MTRKPMLTVLSILKSIALIYFLIVVIMAVFQDRLIFFPQPISNLFVNQYNKYSVSYTHQGTQLEGWFIGEEKISESNPLIIYYGGNAEEVSGNLLDMNRYPNHSFLFMNYRGFGNSGGKPSQETLINDALFILNHLIEKEEIDPFHIILVGRSLGSGVAVQVAHRISVRAVILVTPFDSLTNVAKNHYPILPINLLLKHPFNSVELAPEIETPALFLMGTEDRVINNSHSLAIYKAWKGPSKLVTIEGVGHNDIQTSALYWQEIRHFIESSAITLSSPHHP